MRHPYMQIWGLADFWWKRILDPNEFVVTLPDKYSDQIDRFSASFWEVEQFSSFSLFGFILIILFTSRCVKIQNL
jgi:hypothetical protein